MNGRHTRFVRRINEVRPRSSPTQVLIYPPAPDSAILPTPPPGFTFLSLHRLNSAMYPVFVRPPQSSATRALPP
jgi:hypothetical protein